MVDLRKRVLEMCLKAGTGHVSSSFSCVEIMEALYYKGILKFDPKNPEDPKRDRFILSKAQVSPLLYVVLADLGFFDKAWLETFAEGRFSVHLQNDVPGVEISAGSLGMGLGIATGVAYALKNRESHVFCLMGDAECYEGSVWESAFMAAHNRLGNLTAIVDRNWMGATDWTEKMCALGSLEDKFKAFGWDAYAVDGHNTDELVDMLLRCKTRKTEAPAVIIADTIKGKNCKLMEGNPLYHSRVPECKDCQHTCEVLDDATRRILHDR